MPSMLYSQGPAAEGPWAFQIDKKGKAWEPYIQRAKADPQLMKVAKLIADSTQTVLTKVKEQRVARAKTMAHDRAESFKKRKTLVL